MEEIPEHWSRFPELAQSKQAKQKVPDFGIPPSVKLQERLKYFVISTPEKYNIVGHLQWFMYSLLSGEWDKFSYKYIIYVQPFNLRFKLDSGWGQIALLSPVLGPETLCNIKTTILIFSSFFLNWAPKLDIWKSPFSRQKNTCMTFCAVLRLHGPFIEPCIRSMCI